MGRLLTSCGDLPGQPPPLPRRDIRAARRPRPRDRGVSPFPKRTAVTSQCAGRARPHGSTSPSVPAARSRPHHLRIQTFLHLSAILLQPRDSVNNAKSTSPVAGFKRDTKTLGLRTTDARCAEIGDEALVIVERVRGAAASWLIASIKNLNLPRHPPQWAECLHVSISTVLCTT